MGNKTVDLEVISKGNNKYTVEMSESLCTKIKFSCIWIQIALLVISVLAGIVATVLCCKCGFFENITVCGFVKCVIRIAIFSSATSIILIFTAKALKPYAKMEFLKEIINNDSDKEYLQSLKDLELRDLVKEGLISQRDLIKKYCDTLLEL